MPQSLTTLLALIAARVGDAIADRVADALVATADRLVDRVAAADDTMDDEQAIVAWLQHVDDVIEAGWLVEVTTDWLIHDVIEPLALEVWGELQDAAVRAQARRPRRGVPPAARRALEMHRDARGRRRQRLRLLRGLPAPRGLAPSAGPAAPGA